MQHQHTQLGNPDCKKTHCTTPPPAAGSQTHIRTQTQPQDACYRDQPYRGCRNAGICCTYRNTRVIRLQHSNFAACCVVEGTRASAVAEASTHKPQQASSGYWKSRGQTQHHQTVTTCNAHCNGSVAGGLAFAHHSPSRPGATRTTRRGTEKWQACLHANMSQLFVHVATCRW
jgi:hypothetical protein